MISTRYSVQPTRVYSENENRYAQFTFNDPDRKIEIEISIIVEIYRHDLMTVQGKETKNLIKGSNFSDYLEQEKYIEKDHAEIQEIEQSLAGNSELETVKNIYDYVIDNMEYEKNASRGIGAVRALRRGKGDCTEFSDIFVALCRANDIPARSCVGYVASQTGTSNPRHNWLEVYLKDYGWVPFDPTSGHAARNSLFRDYLFSRINPVYINISYLRNDSALNQSQFASYSYRGGRVRLTNSIEFKPVE